MSRRKKLIEVALPLEAINRESAREKSLRHGHPSTLHLWWARRPLAACRALLFASLVDDPSSSPERFPTGALQEAERQRLFRIIEELIVWENSTNDRVLEAARSEIARSTGGKPPVVVDPFCGGGSIPLEAQRLGLEVRASDLNPVAVLISKALVEIPPKFSGKPPANQTDQYRMQASDGWKGAKGLALDVRNYGAWMRSEAERRIGQLYPKVSLEDGKGQAVVIAWLWARTIRCPNPACGIQMPLIRSFLLSKKGESYWVKPDANAKGKRVSFQVRKGPPGPGEGTVNRRGARCASCGTPVPFDYVRAEGKAERMHPQLMAIVAEGPRGRLYLPPAPEQVAIAEQAKPQWEPNVELPHNPRDFKTPNYGMRTFADLFTARQLVALATLSSLVAEARLRVLADAVAGGFPDDGLTLDGGGRGATAYADAVATYLAIAVDRMSDYSSSICSWHAGRDTIRNTFARQAVPMTWDFAETNPFSDSTGSFQGAVDWVAEVVAVLPSGPPGYVKQLDAAAAIDGVSHPLVSTDPPYYDNIGYADLSDFFYVWLRRSIAGLYPSLFSTVLTPKAQELVATPYRFGGDREKAREFFEKGLGKVFAHLRENQHPDYPISVFYAFKQAETDESEDGDGTITAVSTGWETMLEGLLRAGLAITGTWPVRSELINRPMASGTNALASSIVLVCRPRDAGAPITTRRDFAASLKRELPEALKNLQHGNIAPVDLAQAAIGPGMAIFSRYTKVLDADGAQMPVRTALSLINQALDEVLAEQESEYDPDTRWAVAWFDQYGAAEGPYGVAETLSKAKNTSVSGLVEAGFLHAKGGKVRLLRREELKDQWDPTLDSRLTVWETTQYLIRSLQSDGESGASLLARKVGPLGEIARDLAYRLYSTCERKRWSQEAFAYNSLVVAWPEVARLAANATYTSAQTTLL